MPPTNTPNSFDAPAGASDPLATPDFADDFGLSGERRERATPPGLREWDGKTITEPGAYLGVPIDRYHSGTLCDGHEVSSTGLKLLGADKGKRSRGKTPRHYYEQYVGPNRKSLDSDALRMGRAFHDALLQPELWVGPGSLYHRLPEGFSRAKSKAMAVEIAQADAAIAAGQCVVNEDEVALVDAMVDAARADPLIAALLGKGEPEVTMVWKDAETGIWCRARPDFMLANRAFALNVKTDADASFDGFSSSIGKYGYAQSAALELDGYAAVFGDAPGTFIFPVVEKPGKGWEPGDYIATAVYTLPPEDVERGKWLNRRALRVLADCYASGKWDGYTPQPEPCGLPGYLRHLIDEGGQGRAHDDAVPDMNKGGE